MKRITPKGIWHVLKNSFAGFSEHKITKLSASLAYYTIFSLAPLMILIVFISSFFFGKEAVEGSIYGQIRGFVGQNAALQLQEIIKNAALQGKGNVAAIVGGVTLLIGATTIFAEIQDSINTIWGLKIKAKAGWFKLVKTRLLSFGVIASLGFLLLVSLGVTALVEGLTDRLQQKFPEITLVVFYIINLLITFVVISTLFAVIFKVLPDAKVKYRDVIAGAIATAILFMLGKFAISFYISKSNLGDSYGTAGSIVVLLVWIYYSSIILYFGAEFTKAFAVEYGHEIYPNAYAVVSRTVEVEHGQKSVQQAETETNKIQADVKDSEPGSGIQIPEKK
ncbi:MAG: YihY/virulence factor BrkB family protein [Ginsengibacter sp.]